MKKWSAEMYVPTDQQLRFASTPWTRTWAMAYGNARAMGFDTWDSATYAMWVAYGW